MNQPDRSKPPEPGKDPATHDEPIPVDTQIQPPPVPYDGLCILVICTGKIWREHYEKHVAKSRDFYTWFSHTDKSMTPLLRRLGGRIPDMVIAHCTKLQLLRNPVTVRLRRVLADKKWFRQESL